ncbi:unnamed protein product [Closterium sp. NIES-54]
MFFVLVYVDDLIFAPPDQRVLASVKEELQRRHTCTDLGELQHYLGLQITRDRAARTITLTHSYMVEQILTRFRFPFPKVQLTLLAVDHGLTAPPSDESFDFSGPYPELELCWLSVLLTGCGKWPHSPPVLFADNRSAVLYEEPRLVGKAKLMQLCYFLLRELQQHGQELVQLVVSEANTADIFTKALPPCDHQPFCTQLGLVDDALYFKVGNNGVTCWVLVYVDSLLTASSSTAMLKELLEAAFELRVISSVERYLGLEIVRYRPMKKLCLHQQLYINKLRRCFIDEE